MTSGGMDGWGPKDLTLLSPKAFMFLALLLDAVEAGHPWPNGVMHGKAAFLAKDEIPSLDPMQYRILLILPILYRRWAGYRLKTLAPWIETWRLEEMFSGIRGAGAEDAWYSTAILAEYAKTHGFNITGGADDVF